MNVTSAWIKIGLPHFYHPLILYQLEFDCIFFQYSIIILVFIFHFCRFKKWFWILIFIISFSTFLPVIFIENVDLTVFNFAPNFMKFGCLANCVSLLLIISLKTEITIQSINIFLFWIHAILLLNLIIVICKTLSSIGSLKQKNFNFNISLTWALSELYLFWSFNCSFILFFYISLLAFEDLSCKSWKFICFIFVYHLVKKLEPFLFFENWVLIS